MPFTLDFRRMIPGLVAADAHEVVEEGRRWASEEGQASLGRAWVLERMRWCEFCGATGTLAVHHVVYRSHGGPDEAWNLLLLCRLCHEGGIHGGHIRLEPPTGLDASTDPLTVIYHRWRRGEGRDEWRRTRHVPTPEEGEVAHGVRAQLVLLTRRRDADLVEIAVLVHRVHAEELWRGYGETEEEFYADPEVAGARLSLPRRRDLIRAVEIYGAERLRAIAARSSFEHARLMLPAWRHATEEERIELEAKAEALSTRDLRAEVTGDETVDTCEHEWAAAKRCCLCRLVVADVAPMGRKRRAPSGKGGFDE